MVRVNRLMALAIVVSERLERSDLGRGGVLLKTGAVLMQQGDQFYICGYAADGHDVRPYC